MEYPIPIAVHNVHVEQEYRLKSMARHIHMYSKAIDEKLLDNSRNI